jgi:Tfp pilus assembly protein PilO
MTINSKRDQIDGMMDDINEREEQSQTKQTDEEKKNSQSYINQRITIAGGFLDFALFVADIEHLKFIIETGKEDVK